MRVEISRIGNQRGATLQVDVERPAGRDGLLDLTAHTQKEVAVVALGGVRVTGQLTHSGECFVFAGEVKAQVRLVCDRCATSFAKSLDVPLEHVFCRQEEPPRLQSDEASPLALDDDGELTRFSGDQIDLWEPTREALLLALPMKVLCKRDCRGLCPDCGADLNNGECDCAERRIDPRIAVLAEVRHALEDSPADELN